MKAFRQIDLRAETRIVASYAAILALICIVLAIRPVLAQEEGSFPEMNLDVKKEYDEMGNLVSVDSVLTWTWSGATYSQEEFDSVWHGGGSVPGDRRALVYCPLGRGGLSAAPPIHHFWHWNGEDSTAYSYLEELFDEKTLEGFRTRFCQPDAFHYPGAGLQDSTASLPGGSGLFPDCCGSNPHGMVRQPGDRMEELRK